ncbi:hypothetical protein V6N13_046312 [Hibiscus sabdariffa]|uniref:Uncharacterized protein n=1 Tax=Hibiscus sabdariffa TaxID=183260 RepID=A0ABR2D9S2_9ROSI
MKFCHEYVLRFDFCYSIFLFHRLRTSNDLSLELHLAHLVALLGTWVLGGHFSRYCLRKVVCGCFLCMEDEVLKAELERRSYSIPGKKCGMMRMLRHSRQNLGALGDKNGEKDKRERVQPTPTRDPV